MIVSSNGILVNKDLTSKLARYIGSQDLEVYKSSANSIEYLTVKSFWVRGDKIGTRNFAQL